MPKYLIERDLPGVGSLSANEFREASRKSCGVLEQLGTQIQWVQSYATADTLYCVYIAPSEVLVREHARISGFPATRIMEIKAIIDPATAEERVAAA